MSVEKALIADTNELSSGTPVGRALTLESIALTST